MTTTNGIGERPRTSSRRVHAGWKVVDDRFANEVCVEPASPMLACVFTAVWACVMAGTFAFLAYREMVSLAFAAVAIIIGTLVCVVAIVLLWRRQQGGRILTARLGPRLVRFDRLDIEIPFERIAEWRVERAPKSFGDTVWFNLDCVLRPSGSEGVEIIELMSSDLANVLETLATRLTELTAIRANGDSPAQPA